jgi:hypothetical protein
VNAAGGRMLPDIENCHFVNLDQAIVRDSDRWFTTPEQLDWQSTRSCIDLRALPFGPLDATPGCEVEIHEVVIGSHESVNLPRTIESSRLL